MATIEVRCKVELSEPIVLATQQDTSYGAIQWDLANGDTATVEMDLAEKEIKRSYEENASKGNWYVNSRVLSLGIWLKIQNVPPVDLDRLYGRHSSAKSFVVSYRSGSKALVKETHQEALELGRRIADDLREAHNRIVRSIRDGFGQHWLELLGDDDEPVQNFLDRVHTEWQEGTNPWRKLCVAPPTLVIEGV